MSQEVINLFDQINVKNTERISEWDRKLCEMHQEYYDFAFAKAMKIYALAEEIEDEDSAFGSILCDSFGNRLSYFDAHYMDVKLTVKNAYDDLQVIQKKFIGFIISHFENAYKVSLDRNKAIETIFPGEPKRGLSMYASQEEHEDYEAKQNAFKSQFEKPISYEKIIDYIFAELGGLSFKDRAADEIREACRYCFKNYNGHRSYHGPEIKGRNLEFQSLINIRNEWSFDRGGKIYDYGSKETYWKVFKALSLYLHDSTDNIFNNFLVRLNDKYGSDLICEHDCGSSFIEGVRIYKNGKVVIKFKDPMKALGFAKEYCNYEENQVAV